MVRSWETWFESCFCDNLIPTCALVPEFSPRLKLIYVIFGAIVIKVKKRIFSSNGGHIDLKAA